MEPEKSDSTNRKQELDRCVQAVQDGDRAAFRRVVELMLPVVRPFVAARSLPGADVDDLVQKSFVEAYKNIGDYQVGTNFQSWLITIARYQTLREATRLRRQADYHSRYIPVALARQMENQLSTHDLADDRLTFLRDCLDKVKASSQELIRHRYAEDLSMEEIASTMQRTAGAVRKELCILRKRLHECIEQKISVANATRQQPQGQR